MNRLTNDTLAYDVYASEFKDCYGVGQQDCQRFVMRLFKKVCAPGDEDEVDVLYAGSFSFPPAYSTMSPPTHITNPNKVTRARSHNRGHGISGHRSSNGGSVASSGWFTFILAMGPSPS